MSIWPLSLCALFVASAPAFAATSVTFVSPACGGETVSGNVSLAAAAGSSAASVRFAMGSYVIGSVARPGVAMTWNSAIAMDGVSAIQATALDASGNAVGAAECLVRISNRQVTLTVDAPNLSETLSGTVSIALTGSDALAYPAVWTLNVDGEQQSIAWTDNAWKNPNSVVLALDTTRFVNGPHELQISMNSRTGPANPQWMNWRGMVNRVIQIDNGRTWMDTVPALQSLYLQPGQQEVLGCTRLYTDGTSGACESPVFVSDTPAVVTVSENGTVLAQQNGFALVTVSDGAKSGSSRVQVAASSQVPHFGGNGQFRNSYDADKSLFVIAPFFLDSTALAQDPALFQAVRDAGVNTLGFGVYSNPRNLTTTLADWTANYNGTVVPKMQWAKDNGFHLLLSGDDMFRNIGTDAWYTLNWPSGKQAVQYAVKQLAQTGVGIGIEGIDEASMLWGPQPTPAGGIGQTPELFTQVQCEGGSCTVSWPNNPIPAGYGFAFAGASGFGSSLTVESSSASGFTFSDPAAPSGTLTAANSPNLEFQWFGGKFCAGNQACAPTVPNNALATMRSWFPVAETGVPVAFPAAAAAAPQVQGNWFGRGSISDYASNYFTSLKTRTTYPWSEGIQEMVGSMQWEFVQRQPYLMLDRPQLMLVSLAGASYKKGASQSATYLPGVDTLEEPGVSPEHVSALMMTAAALGGAGIRLYYYEPAGDAVARQNDAPGTELQTGCNPTNLQPESWQAMGYASNLLTGVLAPYLLGAAENAPSYGRNIVTAVRQGPEGTMLMIVNGNDWQRTVPVSLADYPTNLGVTRYMVTAAGVTTTKIAAGSTGDSVTLTEGATAVYLIR